MQRSQPLIIWILGEVVNPTDFPKHQKGTKEKPKAGKSVSVNKQKIKNTQLIF